MISGYGILNNVARWDSKGVKFYDGRLAVGTGWGLK